MKLAVLFSGGKDSTYSAWLAKKQDYELICLITLYSENPDSYMFHTPSIKRTKQQAKVMELPLIVETTKGAKETELKDLERAIKKAKTRYKIQGIVTGAIESVYQASRIQKICSEHGLECFNPLWQKDDFQYLKELIQNKFKVIITGVASEGLDKNWLGREIDSKFIEDITKIYEKFGIHVAGEGGEFETFVLYAPDLFSKPLKVVDKKVFQDGNSWKMEIEVK